MVFMDLSFFLPDSLENTACDSQTSTRGLSSLLSHNFCSVGSRGMSSPVSEGLSSLTLGGA